MHLVKIIGSDSLSGKAPSVALPKGQRVQDGTGQKWHTRALSQPNLNLAKPKRAFVPSSSAVPGINDRRLLGKACLLKGAALDELRCSLPHQMKAGSTTLSYPSAHGTAPQTQVDLGIT